jgi:hypothetical protein
VGGIVSDEQKTDESAERRSSVSRDPEVLAEEKKSRIWHLRLERYAEVAKTVGVILQTFRAEAVSLVSGIGTLILGWYHIKKWIARAHQAPETPAQLQAQPELRSIRRELIKMSSAQRHAKKGTAAHPVMLASSPASRSATAWPVYSEDSSGGGDSGGGASSAPPMATITLSDGQIQADIPTLQDPMIYLLVAVAAAFVWSTWASWIKRRRAAKKEGGTA